MERQRGREKRGNGEGIKREIGVRGKTERGEKWGSGWVGGGGEALRVRESNGRWGEGTGGERERREGSGRERQGEDSQE